MNLDNNPSSDDFCDRPSLPAPVDPRIAALSDKYFTSFRSDTYKQLRFREAEVLAVPWGPRIDVIMDPRSAPGAVGGRVRLFARTSGTEIEIGSAFLSAVDQAVTLSGGIGCDEYVIKASLGSDPGPNAKAVESYFFARVYAAR